MMLDLNSLPVRNINVGETTVTIQPNEGHLTLNGTLWSWEMLDFLMICRLQRPSLFTWSRLSQLFTDWKFCIIYQAIHVEAMFTYLSTIELPDFTKYEEDTVLDVETLSESARVIHMHITQPWKEINFENPKLILTISLLVIFPLSHTSHRISIDDVLPIFQYNFSSDVYPGHNWTTDILLQLHQFLLDVNDHPELGITLKSEIDRMDLLTQIDVAGDIRKLAAQSAGDLGGDDCRQAAEQAKWDISEIMVTHINVMRFTFEANAA